MTSLRISETHYGSGSKQEGLSHICADKKRIVLVFDRSVPYELSEITNIFEDMDIQFDTITNPGVCTLENARRLWSYLEMKSPDCVIVAGSPDVISTVKVSLVIRDREKQENESTTQFLSVPLEMPKIDLVVVPSCYDVATLGKIAWLHLRDHKIAVSNDSFLPFASVLDSRSVCDPTFSELKEILCCGMLAASKQQGSDCLDSHGTTAVNVSLKMLQHYESERLNEEEKQILLNVCWSSALCVANSDSRVLIAAHMLSSVFIENGSSKATVGNVMASILTEVRLLYDKIHTSGRRNLRVGASYLEESRNLSTAAPHFKQAITL